MDTIEIDLRPLRPFVEQVIRDEMGSMIELAVRKSLREALGGLIGGTAGAPEVKPERFKATGPVKVTKAGIPAKKSGPKPGSRTGGRKRTGDYPALAASVQGYLAMGMTKSKAFAMATKGSRVSPKVAERAYREGVNKGTIAVPEAPEAPAAQAVPLETSDGERRDTRAFWGMKKRGPAESDAKVARILETLASAGGELPSGELRRMTGLDRIEMLFHIKKLLERGALRKTGNRNGTVYYLMPKKAERFWQAYAGSAPPIAVHSMLNGAGAQPPAPAAAAE